jgi:hypothetical protein
MTESITYYKATRTDGTDFRTGSVSYDVGSTVEHPRPHKRDASGYLSVSTVPTDCVGASWPLRLVEVEAAEVWTDNQHPNKRCTHSLTVLRELDPMLALGPQGQAVVALIERCKTLTYDDAKRLGAAWGAAWDAARGAAWGAAWDAARDAARGAARDAAWGAARGAARGAAWGAAWDAARGAAWDAARGAARDAAWGAAGLMCHDLIGDGFTQEQYDLLTEVWRKAIGPLHPDDVDLREPVQA